ncbi:MAG: hypothetical protein ACSHX5_03740 [Phycisphaerales bacterium]
MHTTPNTNAPRQSRRPIAYFTPLALVLAAGLAACSSSTTQTRAKTHTNIPSINDSFTEQEAAKSQELINPADVQGQYTASTFIEEGDSIDLPQQWVSEARESTASIQAQRTNAQAFELETQSNYIEHSAIADARLQDAIVDHATNYADAERTRVVHDSRLHQMDAQIQARQFQNESKWDRQEAFLASSVNEWQAEINRMRSETEADWTSSLAEHDRMMATYTAVEQRGNAEIDQMVQAADLTETRAFNKVQNLRTQAQTIAEKTQAEVDKLNQLISTTTEQTNATYAQLTQQAQSLEGEMSSQIAIINAKANQFQAADAVENFELELEAADVNYKTSLAEAEDLKLDAQQQASYDQAEIARQTSDANAQFKDAKTDYERIEHLVRTHFDKALADVENLKAKAIHQENITRANFIKAEIDARVAALKEQATHDRQLAEDELKNIEAEAFAYAKDLQADMAREFAQQMKKGSFVIPGNDIASEQTATSTDSTPTLAKAEPKPAQIEADRIAAFRTGLAKAAQINQFAQADRLDAIAVRDAEIAKLDNWWSSQQSNFNTTMASITAYEQKSNAEVSRMLTKSESLIASAETERTRALVDAESGKTEVLATIETLRGNSETLGKKKAAKVKQLLAQAEATKRIGDSQLASLEVQRDSTSRRGNAKSQQLLAEASSLEQSQRAVVAQMQQEIEASREILSAELARLDQAAQSYYAIAEANYNEGLSMAQSFERIAIANTSELTARHIAARKQSQADVEYMGHLASAAELNRDAEVARMYAQADEALGYKQAEDIAIRGQIEADQQVALASSVREFTVANARETGVRAHFDKRIAMTQAQRDRAYAGVYAQNQQQLANTELAAAQAASYAELSDLALARLNAASESFQKTAQRNWDSRLAMPTTFESPAGVDALYNETQSPFDKGIFATVPTDFE